MEAWAKIKEVKERLRIERCHMTWRGHKEEEGCKGRRMQRKKHNVRQQPNILLVQCAGFRTGKNRECGWGWEQIGTNAPEWLSARKKMGGRFTRFNQRAGHAGSRLGVQTAKLGYLPCQFADGVRAPPWWIVMTWNSTRGSIPRNGTWRGRERRLRHRELCSESPNTSGVRLEDVSTRTENTQPIQGPQCSQELERLARNLLDLIEGRDCAKIGYFQSAGIKDANMRRFCDTSQWEEREIVAVFGSDSPFSFPPICYICAHITWKHSGVAAEHSGVTGIPETTGVLGDSLSLQLASGFSPVSEYRNTPLVFARLSGSTVLLRSSPYYSGIPESLVLYRKTSVPLRCVRWRLALIPAPSEPGYNTIIVLTRTTIHKDNRLVYSHPERCDEKTAANGALNSSLHAATLFNLFLQPAIIVVPFISTIVHRIEACLEPL
ncbi:hypothetical protein B0H16DRAFT_1484234 [Mycena metata]|uniref:Uncharacterized protein n=1 Tax=Mycena metata TaxID=1033252 RepID=A0AAD7GNE7_9AGAR|nr:hypothetical protein B0H16DRAFT_1484234 [Mycena metata]